MVASLLPQYFWAMLPLASIQKNPGPKLTAKERLIALLVVYEPESLQKVEPMLREFKGRERDLFRALGRRFGISTVEALSVGALTIVILTSGCI